MFGLIGCADSKILPVGPSDTRPHGVEELGLVADSRPPTWEVIVFADIRPLAREENGLVTS